jgi:MFS family permease
MHHLARLALPQLDDNGRIVLAARTLRSFGFGLNSVALGLYLSQLGLAGAEIGLVLSAALAGTLLVTLVITLYGDRIGRRRLLMAGSALMAAAALVPVLSDSPLLLAAIALSGMVAVNANESTGLQTIDQALLPGAVASSQRTAAFALYNLLAATAAALGALSVGLLPLLGPTMGLSGAQVYAPAFIVYALLGVAGLLITARLDRRAESGEPLAARRLALDRSRPVVARLSVLFGLDAFAGSFTVQSFLAYFLATRFGAEPAAVGGLFFASMILSAGSFPVAAWLARRIGLINTMVFTHIPSSLFLVGMALSPSFAVAAAFQLARAALASMDVPARQSYTMAVVDPAERTAAAGVTSLSRAIAGVPGPYIGGVLVTLGLGVPLIATAVLKITYDLALFALFRARPAPEERLTQEENAVAEIPPPAPGAG